MAETEGERESERESERERERERMPNRLHDVNTEPDTGLSLTDLEIMASAEIKS